jgi:hypothetical protein
MNIGNILSAEKLKSAAGLGAGALASRYVVNKISASTQLTGKTYATYVANGVPVLAGLFLTGQANSLIKAAGQGMIANSVGNLFANLIDKDGTKGLFGTEVMMQGADTLMQGDGDGSNSNVSANYPNTSFGNAAGEMDY